MNILSARGLRKSYGAVEVVSGVDLEVASGECFGLLGPNGAGRTTTLKLCLGLTRPQAVAFSAVGLVMTVLARGWDFFSFYMTLMITPMMMISGVFFPADRLPAPLVAVAQALPLYHGVELVRPVVAGRLPEAAALHVAVLIGYAAAGYAIAIFFARKRFSD